MAKQITREMIEGMTLDQRKTLKANAQKRDTQAAKDVLVLLSQDDLMTKSAAETTAAQKPRKTRAAAKLKPVEVHEDEAEDED